MKLRSLHIQHFKSLDNLEIDLSDPITVLVGPNGVGKSNIVGAISLIHDAVDYSLKVAISTQGGMRRIMQTPSSRKQDISFRLNFSAPAEDTQEPGCIGASYAFSLSPDVRDNFFVASEEASISAPNSKRKSGQEKLRFKREDVVASSSKTSRGRSSQVRTAFQEQLIFGYSSPGLPPWCESIISTIDGWRRISPDMGMIRIPSKPASDRELDEDGLNWVEVIRAHRRTPKGRRALARVFEAMSSLLPGFKDVITNNVGGYLIPEFRFIFERSIAVGFDPVQLSDGTIRAFLILLALYQIPEPRLLVIEEPELSIHPGVLGILADAFKEASERTQLVITTHSPQLVDHFLPEQIRVVTMEDGKTQVAPIRAAQVEAVKRRLLSMGEFMKAEGLQPETVG